MNIMKDEMTKLTVEDAKELLETAPQSDTEKSKLNSLFTQKQMVNFILDALNEDKDTDILTYFRAKRVFQVYMNERNPGIWVEYKRKYF